MRICPKCGYSDPPIWKVTRYRVHCDYARIEDFREYYPRIKIEKGERVSDGLYVYKRSSKGDGLYVERQCLRDNPNAMLQWIPDFETPTSYDRQQTKLLEVINVTQSDDKV